MKRIDINYGGQHYSVSGRDYDDVREEITAGLASGHAWLRVNVGEGENVACDLLISAGVPLALVPVSSA